MLSKCANPSCSAPFQYLRDGKLFKFDLHPPSETGPHLVGKKPARKVEHFWLCGKCSKSMTLSLEQQKKVVLIPLRPWYRGAAAS